MNSNYQEPAKTHDPFVYLAAHDLRAPLMSAKGLLYIMRLESERKNLDHYFRLLEISIDKMNQSIDNIISYSKNGSPGIIPQEVNFVKIAEDSIQTLRYLPGAESVKIELSVDQGVTFFSDYNSLSSIFTNLLSNAIRYRDAQKQSYLKVTVTADKEGAELVFEDNGIGIEAELQEKVFDKFFRVNPEGEGTGLGLYMVKRSVDKLKGRIRIHSTPGEGTTFALHVYNFFSRQDNW